MTTGLERQVCEGPLCAGVRTHLVSQFHESGVCWACHAKATAAETVMPKAAKDWIKGNGHEKAEKRAAPKPVAEGGVKGMKQCVKCKHQRDDGEFFKVNAKGETVATTTCLGCRKKAMEAYHAGRNVSAKRVTPAHRNLSAPAVPQVVTSAVKSPLLLAHGSRLLAIALLGPREQDADFIRALCAGLLQDSLNEAGCKDLVELAAQEA
jgi:hypothetical protein